MRNVLLAVLFTAVSMCAFAGDGEPVADGGDLVRVPILNGLYTVEAPGDWHVAISGDDFSAAFAEDQNADGTLIIAAPNPAVTDIAGYARLTTAALVGAFEHGEITGERKGEVDGFPAHTLWFVAFGTDGGEMLGWGKTVNFDGVAVQAVVLAKADNFEAFMRLAEPIFDSYQMDADMVEENIDLLREIGLKTLENLNGPASEEHTEAPVA